MQTLRRSGLIFVVSCLLASCCHQSIDPQPKKRDASMRKIFLSQNPCPSTGKNKGACLGYVVDHIVPIKRGGGDHPYNMQWQTVQDGKEKDTWE